MTQASERLWPEPEHMHAYIVRWSEYIDRLNHELEAERIGRQEEVERLWAKVNGLKHQVKTQVAPYEQQLKELRAELDSAQSLITTLEQEHKDTIERLALVLETSPTARGITLTGLVSQVILVVEESKKMIRENL